MSCKPIFVNNNNADKAYQNANRAESQGASKAKKLIEKLWEKYCPYADTNFTTEIQNDFFARFWEMYLACTMLSLGIKIQCLNPGPDILMELNDKRIWNEAICPGPGGEGNPDKVPSCTPNPNKARKVPDKEIILRYRHAIHEKFGSTDSKYNKYLSNSIVNKSDSYIVAISATKIPEACIESIYSPRIVRTVYPIGHLQLKYDKTTNRVTGTNYQYNDQIVRKTGSNIDTDIFLNPEYKKLSGIIFSSFSPGNQLDAMGEDFIFVHNLKAENPVPKGFIKIGKEFWAEKSDNEYIIRSIDHNN